MICSYTDVPSRVEREIRKELEGLGAGYKVVLISRYDLDRANEHLYVVLAEDTFHRNRYATWIYNSALKTLNIGHYDMNFKEALADFLNRICWALFKG